MVVVPQEAFILKFCQGSGSATMARTTGSTTRDFPVHTLEKAMVIIQAIGDKGAGHKMDRLLVASAIGRTPSSSEFRRLLSSSLRYGLTTGTEKADYIEPTPLGAKIIKPTSAVERRAAIFQASMTPPIFKQVLEHFNRNRLPEQNFFKNTLERTFHIPPSQTEELSNIITENAQFVGILEDISGVKYIRFDGNFTQDIETNENDTSDSNDGRGEYSEIKEVMEEGRKEPSARQPSKIFVAHGKNRRPLESLKKILDKFKIPYAVAIDEANKGRPISAKVAELMKECSAGIFIFTKDEEFLNRKSESIWRPSENVVYELGAANVMWDKRIIILKQDGVNFPSDFSDLGYITFSGDELGEKTVDILAELVGLDLVKIQAA
jgi:hypothetical protein